MCRTVCSCDESMHVCVRVWWLEGGQCCPWVLMDLKRLPEGINSKGNQGVSCPLQRWRLYWDIGRYRWTLKWGGGSQWLTMQCSPPPEAFSRLPQCREDATLRCNRSARSHGSMAEVHRELLWHIIPPQHPREVKTLLSLDGLCVGGPGEVSRHLGTKEPDGVYVLHTLTIDVESDGGA